MDAALAVLSDDSEEEDAEPAAAATAPTVEPAAVTTAPTVEPAAVSTALPSPLPCVHFRAVRPSPGKERSSCDRPARRMLRAAAAGALAAVAAARGTSIADAQLGRK